MTDPIAGWVMGIGAAAVVVYIVETLQPGVLLGPVSEGFETVGPLFWLVLIAGGVYVAYS